MQAETTKAPAKQELDRPGTEADHCHADELRADPSALQGLVMTSVLSHARLPPRKTP